MAIFTTKLSCSLRTLQQKVAYEILIWIPAFAGMTSLKGTELVFARPYCEERSSYFYLSPFVGEVAALLLRGG